MSSDLGSEDRIGMLQESSIPLGSLLFLVPERARDGGMEPDPCSGWGTLY